MISGGAPKLTGMTAPLALSVSAVDPAGGLLVADLLAFGALGVAGSGLVTAVTATAAACTGISSAPPWQAAPTR